VVAPGRWPWSRSACRTQFDSVCAVQPILAAIEAIAAHWDGGSEEGPDNRWGECGHRSWPFRARKTSSENVPGK
jgi:hypothetical protein